MEKSEKETFDLIRQEAVDKVSSLRNQLAEAEKELNYLDSLAPRFKTVGKKLILRKKPQIASTNHNTSIRKGKPLSPHWVKIMSFINLNSGVGRTQIIEFINKNGLGIRDDQVRWQLREYVRNEWLDDSDGYSTTELGREKFGLPHKA